MRTILIWLTLMALAIGVDAQSIQLYGPYLSQDGTPRTNVVMTLALVSPRNVAGYSSDYLQQTTDTNGQFVFTLAAGFPVGLFSLTAGDSSGTRWPITTWAATPGSNTIWNLVNWNAVIPANNQSNYLTAAQTLALINQVPTNGVGVATNFSLGVVPIGSNGESIVTLVGIGASGKNTTNNTVGTIAANSFVSPSPITVGGVINNGNGTVAGTESALSFFGAGSNLFLTVNKPTVGQSVVALDNTGTNWEAITISGGGATNAISNSNGQGTNTTIINQLTVLGTQTNSLGTSFALGATNYSATQAIQSPQFVGGGAGLTALTPANISAGTAGINISGNAATATSATSATTAGEATDAVWAQNATNAVVSTNLVSGASITNVTATGTFTGNGNGLTNVQGSNIAQQSTNLVYYFDPLATNTVSQPNNPLAPYHTFDAVNTAALFASGAVPTFYAINGVYYFTNLMTNVCFIGQSESGVILVDQNLTGSSVNETLASIFAVATNNLVFMNFTAGFTVGTNGNQTSYNALWVCLAGTVSDTNEFAANINYPRQLPLGITGGSGFDGMFHTVADTWQWTFNNVTMDVPWDAYVFQNGSSTLPQNIRFVNCYTTTECLTNSSNPNGTCRLFYTSQPGEGSIFSWIGSTFVSVSSSNASPIQVLGPLMTNCTINIQGSSFRQGDNFGEFYLTSKTTGTVTNLAMNISGSSIDYLFSSSTSANWQNSTWFNYSDAFGNTYVSGNETINSNLTVIGNSSFQGTNNLNVLGATNVQILAGLSTASVGASFLLTNTTIGQGQWQTWQSTNFMLGQGIVNWALPETTCLTNASFTFGLPINLNAAQYNNPVVDVHNTLGSLITITPNSYWHTSGTWNCTNVSKILLNFDGVYTNAACVPIW